jgi:hypothetical protein
VISGSKSSLYQAALVAVQPQTLAPVVHGHDEYVAVALQPSDSYLASLNAQARMAWRRESVLWQLFLLVFILTLAAGSAGVVLIFLASLKVAIASGAAGVIPGCTSAMLKRAHRTQIKNIDSIEAKRDAQLRLRQSAEVISALPPSPKKEELQVDYARKMLSRIPK